MHTSRAAVHRLLDPENTSVTLNSIVKVMSVLGRKLQISIA
jgi:antitoxin HicB